MDQPRYIESVTFHGLYPGKKVIITGAVHGNEVSGSIAIPKIIQEIRQGLRHIERGSVTFVAVTNPLAYKNNARMGDRNLNRELSEKPIPQNYEDRIANVLCPLLKQHDVLIDIHSLSSDSPPFVLFGPANNTDHLEPFQQASIEEDLVLALGLPTAVCGWLPAYERLINIKRQRGVSDISMIHGVGTTEYMRSIGGAAVTVECGLHDHPKSPEVAYEVIVRGLHHFGIIKEASIQPQARPLVIEMIDPIMVDHEDDRLYKAYQAGERLSKGQEVGMRANGQAIKMPYDGAIIFARISSELDGELGFFCQISDRV